MAVGPDPFRTLGLNPGASIDEIRRAYRRLAKANHPDSAGEAALPRFLAIQAAYEALVEPTVRGPGSRPAQRDGGQPGPAWRADPERARATRENAGRRAGSRPRTGAGPDGQSGGKGANRTAGGAGGTAGSRGAAGRAARPETNGRPARGRPANKAVPGSTSYDAAEDEPFEPEWSGGTWYGSSSGTYWTINPKEYADPRKHGPEYQRRARRRVGPDGADEEPLPPEADAVEEPGAAEPGAAAWTTAAPGGDEAASTAGPASAATPHDTTDPVARALGLIGGFGGRLALALVGWPPIGLALASAAGEVTGCSRFAAGCVDVFGVGTWLVQLAIIALLLAIPALAAIASTGTLVALAAAVPAAVILSATGGSRQPEASAVVLAAVLTIAYLVGIGIGTARRLGVRRVPWRP
jgi:curved DNA-binding protein CbpA